MIPGLSLSVKMPVGYFMRILGLGQSKWNGRQIAEFLIISHHSWFSDIPREILHQTEPRCFSVGSMHSGFHSLPGRLLTNEFREWLPTSNFDSSENNTLCHSDHVQFSWACAQANWHFLFVSMVFLRARQPLIPLSARRWSTVLVLVYTRFTIDPENVGSPYTVSQATLAECLRETYCQRAFSLQLPLPQWNTNIRSIQTYFADLRCEKWWIKL